MESVSEDVVNGEVSVGIQITKEEEKGAVITAVEAVPIVSSSTTTTTDASESHLSQTREGCSGQSKTGTGKTVAFLLPAIEATSDLRPVCDKKNTPINVLVVCQHGNLQVKLPQRLRNV
ncbi:hypothetical protein GIB67_020300 [Kingdonia uniflora]|uniref:DEAD/DEAH-box helicase domain-containing protein n=1 Tax=Kingdonia uniflora TaxID=39325 RepID=A0A7J7KVS9_9MAGN|nr:hypothetical protein GIB67_020300 [Kingdonia uniflora]